ncbi:MAG: hypothetical protein ACXW2G_14155, partial [Burkholderiaceae bacterium]
SYNPSYLAAARRPATVVSDGKALLVTTQQDDAYVYTGNPTSFTRSATQLTLPLGSIVRETAIAAFGETFKGGVDVAHQVSDPARYVVIVAPKLVAFSYEYNQLKNVGLGVTPTAVVNVDVRVLDATGATRWQRSYASGPVEGPVYRMNTSPGDEISKVTHKALYDVFSKAAVEVVREVLAVPPGARPG